ncbi:MAG: hypothetical protein F4047_09655, partial [Caldilineaceae bacterium SB0670_bin_27]|nr:hypothetical protein [Caldilineaceae bacterium SB0670_bin_27]
MSLTPDELVLFHRQGYLLKTGLFTAEDLKPLQDALTEVIDHCARELQADGKLTNIHADQPFGRRLASIHAENEDAGKEITSKVMGKGGGGYNGPAMLQT